MSPPAANRVLCVRVCRCQTWNTVVQIRQKGAKHKRTLFFLEQLLLKHNVCEKALSIKEQPDGMDVYWAHKSHAMHMMAFLKSVVPIKEDSAKRLISQDEKSNIKNYKFTFIADVRLPACARLGCAKTGLVCVCRLRRSARTTCACWIRGWRASWAASAR